MRIVFLGNEQRRIISLLVTNSFDEKNFARDVALVKVNKRFYFNSFVGAICIPGENEAFYGNTMKPQSVQKHNNQIPWKSVFMS